MTKEELSLANTFKQCPELHYTQYLISIANDFEKKNPKFNKELWLSYIRGKCSLKGKKKK